MAKSREPRVSHRAPRKRLTQEQWQVAIADELRATMARKRILQKDIMRVLGVHDPSYVSRRMNGIVAMTVPELVVLCDYFDEDITAVMTRAKDNATNPCLSHSDKATSGRTSAPTPQAAAPAAIRVA